LAAGELDLTFSLGTAGRRIQKAISIRFSSSRKATSSMDINSAAIRYGNKPDEMPDYPVRVFLKTLNSPTGTVGLDAIEVRELKEDEPSKAEARRDLYPKISPWPKKK